ncbi:calmodulin-like protein [Pseudoalteromonas sp. BSi20311]|jgi:Ca2+-binding EF-hand superfamily protein|uniref:calmodulin n=1 Tax=unclassified Pseudoalteromonas TaxID=194690 RepID=UPI00023181C7|nr:calmodulin [Pseudoalteromonas sp. BSi20311]MDC2855092.1 calmodulin [Ningiella sp. W23]GAA65317.1 calmodulin-like protein [Pseudoalteromonas sp. BSi20311]
MKKLQSTLVLMALASSSAVFASTDFETLDVDGSGTISQAEASVAAELMEQFAELDGDGNGELSKDEFSAY